MTRVLNAIERRDAKATDELLPLIYEELRILAARKLSDEAPSQTLQATALVHEAHLRLVGDESPSWENRGHFFAAASGNLQIGCGKTVGPTTFWTGQIDDVRIYSRAVAP